LDAGGIRADCPAPEPPPAASQGREDRAVVVADVVVAVVMLSLAGVISLDSAPARGVLYAVARWRHRRWRARRGL